MKIEYGFNEEKAVGIAKKCGSATTRKNVRYLRAINYFNKGDDCHFYCEFFDDVAFVAFTINDTHIRLYEIAVVQEQQGKGYGRFMFRRLEKIAKLKDIHKITLRVAKDSKAVNFYKRNGAKIVGSIGEDYKMEKIF